MNKNLRFLLPILLVIATILGLAKIAYAQTPSSQYKVYIYLFWGDGCPHCAKAKPYFENLAANHSEIELNTYEVYYDADNQNLFSLMAGKFGIEQLAVPTIFIGPYYLQGYSEELNSDIETVILKCAQDGCADPGLGVINVDTNSAPTSTLSLAQISTSTPVGTATQTLIMTATAAPAKSDFNPTEGSTNLNNSHELVVPLLGVVNLDSKSIFVSTALIALVDGFNPCSLWVLTMLLVLTLHTGSRKKVLIIGIIFLTVTAGIYALFIIGLFSILKIASFMGWIRILVALIALIFALVNIKDYFWYKEGVSFTISDEKKPGIFKKMRAVVDASQSFGGLVAATVTLAAGVSLVEFACTAGFPVIWTNILTEQGISGTTFIVSLLIYMLIYQADELVIFFTSVVTLKVSRLEEKHGRILKLVSGVLMLTLSVVMLVDPALMNNLNSSLIVFGIAFLFTIGLLFVFQIILPKIGVSIGSGSRQSRVPIITVSKKSDPENIETPHSENANEL